MMKKNLRVNSPTAVQPPSINDSLKRIISIQSLSVFTLIIILLLGNINFVRAQKIINPSTTPGYDSLKASLISVSKQGVAFTTDYADYLPGETVVFTGTGFWANENISLKISFRDSSQPNTIAYQPFIVKCDENGSFMATWYVDSLNLGKKLVAYAVGVSSGYTSQVLFTDATIANSCYFAPDASYTTIAANDD